MARPTDQEITATEIYYTYRFQEKGSLYAMGKLHGNH
jgi:hypothetical protein